ncbi:PQQ-dependent sugar dehydrogenase [Dyadobacter sediminis]|uniref:T9SS type A sorting domain-containing protein n=2 Tax=Dyadobacter sediminis TaxID=1493691 RepID=A0A5R9K6S5_9BACT|nr:PQQ-dependent sugar dehydrogenase [Dyadobacter sediminis]TLU89483.1 T9SS type A sorting domain-containing protein [Dyadobacter sediminis]
MKNLDFPGFSRNFLLLLFSIMLASQAISQAPDVKINMTPVITNLTAPMQIVHAGDGSNRIFIAERRGVVKVFEAGSLASPSTYLNMNLPDSTVGAQGEGGLLSIAFHPDYATNGYIYTYYTDRAGDLVLARYTAATSSAATINANTRFEILKIPHPVNRNHNGGELHFGYNDGFLYLSTGDGGGANDIPRNAQNPSSLLGKILRIDVNMPAGETGSYKIPVDNPYGNEVFATGLRNPFRWSFDREEHGMWIGDVGQGALEEINFLPDGSVNGANFGWRCYEGNAATPGIDRTGCGPIENYTVPVYTYPNSTERGKSVIGGVVYRGRKHPLMYGYYIGMDYYSGDIHKILADGSVKEYQTSALAGVVDIGEDESGEIYAVAGNAVYNIYTEEGLPVTLLNFSGFAGNEGVKLTWQTNEERNFREFEIEHSNNAIGFEKAGTIPAANALSGSNYTFFHRNTGKGNFYYRLKMIDTDNTFKYSRMITVNMTGMFSENFVRPSIISNGTINVVIDEPFQSLELINTKGQVSQKEEISGRNGAVSIPLKTPASGIYTVRMAGPDKVVQQKVLVKE